MAGATERTAGHAANRDRHGPGNGRKDFRRDDRRGGGGRPRDGKGRGPGNGRSGAGNRPGQRPSNRTGRDGRPSDRRPRDDRRKPEGIPEHKPRDAPEPSLTIPSTPQRILFKGVDCEVNGRTDLAMILYLHGAAMLSKGCENNMPRGGTRTVPHHQGQGREGLPRERDDRVRLHVLHTRPGIRQEPPGLRR